MSEQKDGDAKAIEPTENKVSGRLSWPGGAELTLCLIPWHKVAALNGPNPATVSDLAEFGWAPASELEAVRLELEQLRHEAGRITLAVQ